MFNKNWTKFHNDECSSSFFSYTEKSLNVSFDDGFLFIFSNQLVMLTCTTFYSQSIHKLKSGLLVINLLASRKVTSLSSSRSVLLPTIRMTMAGLASVLASVNQLAKQLNDSLMWRLMANKPHWWNEMLFWTWRQCHKPTVLQQLPCNNSLSRCGTFPEN